MNHIKILKRAFDITLNYRVLWIFGILLALTTGSGGGNGGSSNTGYKTGSSDFPALTPQMTNTLIAAAIGLGCLILILIVVGSIVRYVTETSVIRMVDEHENSGQKLTFRQGFRLGWSRAAWKMFLMDLVITLICLFAFLLLLALAALPLLVWLTKNVPLQVLGTVISVGLGLLVIFFAIAVSLAVTLVTLFARRAIALDNLGVREALRRGYQLVQGRLGEILLMGVMMFGIGLVWAVINIPIVLTLIIAAALVGGLPALLVGSIVGIFAQGNTPWIVAAIVGAPIFLIVLIIPGSLISGWGKIFASSAWTLTYRETVALEKAPIEPPAPEPAI